MDISPRPYATQADLRKLQTATSEWIAAAGFKGYLHIDDIALRLFNGMRCYSPRDIVRLWEDASGDLFGWCMLYPRWNSFEALLHPDYDELAPQIFDWAERETRRWMQKEGHGDQPIYLDVFDDDKSRSALLEQRGYVRGEPTHLIGIRSLADSIPDAMPPQGFSIRSLEGLHEADKVVTVVNAAFGWSWTGDEFRQFMASPGFSHDNLVIVAPDGRFAAFCYVMLDYRNLLGMFEDVCTHPDFQRLGLAKALLYAGMKHMRQSGMHTALVPYDASLGAAPKLYESVGFQPKYRIYNYVRTQK